MQERKKKKRKGMEKSVFHDSILYIVKPKSLPRPAGPPARPTSPLSPNRHAHPPGFYSPGHLQFFSLPPHNWLQPTHTWFTAPFTAPHPPNPASASLDLQVLHSPFRSSSSSFPGHCLPQHSILPHSQGFYGLLTK